jgi:U1 small nuclear ribonucleoprotein
MSAAVANALPPSILALFAPRPPVEFKPPIQKRKCRPYSSMATLVAEFEDPATAVQQLPAPLPESKEARRERIAKLRAEQAAEKVAAAAESYDPNSDTKIKGDPYKTLFVARINYESTEAKIKKEFEQFGPIKRIRLVLNTDSGKPRGYAFFEYEQERDMKTAYK